MSTILFRLLCILLPLAGSLQAYGQFKLKGKVFDSINSEPLAGAVILSLPAGKSVITDENGLFELSLNDSTGLVEVAYLGYKRIQIPLNSQKGILNIGLTANAEKLGEIIVKANLDPQSLSQQAGAVSLVELSDLNTGNTATIEPVLNGIPGIFMHSGALNTNRITMRGIGARSLFSTSKIRAYFNHIPLTNGIGETTLEDIDLGLLSRVEVIKGPSSSVYGAGLGGTIILNTEKEVYNKTAFTNAINIGSFGLLRNTHRISHSSDLLNLSLNYNRTQSEGYRENNNYHRNAFSFSGQFYPSLNGTISVLANFIDLKAFIPSSIDSTTYIDDPRSAAFTWKKTKGFEDYSKSLTGVSYDHRFKKRISLAASLFYNHFNSYEVRPFNILNEKSRMAGGRTSLYYKHEKLKTKINFTTGGEFFVENYDWTTFENIDGLGQAGITISDNRETRKYFNFFNKVSIKLPSATSLTAGLNLNATDYRIIDLFNGDSTDLSGNYAFEKIISPRFTITHQLKKKQTLYFAASHGFSPPSLEETLTPEGNINPEIKPEKGWNLELGSRGYMLNSKVYYDLAVFTMFVSDLLVSERTGPDIFVGVNAGKTTHAGLEADIRWTIISASAKPLRLVELSAHYAYSHFRFSEFIDDDNDYSGNKLTGVPDHVLNLTLDVKAGSGLYGRLGFRHVSRMAMRDDNTKFSSAYSVFNLKTGFQKLLSDRWQINIFAGLNNIFNEKYASMILVNAGSFGGNAPRYYYPGLPFNAFGGLSVGYNFRK